MKAFGVEKFKDLLAVGSFSVIVEFLMGLSDSIVAGNLIGEEALAGINLMQPVLTTVTFFAGLIAVGMSINYSLESGRCALRRAHEIFSQGLWTVLGTGALLVAAMILGRDAFMSFMGASPAITAYASDYWTWYAAAALFEPLAIFALNCCYADGDARLCGISYAVQLGGNLLVSIVGVKFGYGTKACAFGTLVGVATAAAVLSVHFFRKSNTFALVRHFDLADSWRIVKSSFGDSSSFFCNALQYFIVTKVVIASFGSEVLPVLSVVLATLGLVEVFGGVAVAVQPVATVYLGERNTKSFRRVVVAAVKVALAEGLGLSIVLACFPHLVIGMVGVDDPTLVAKATTAIRLVSVGLAATALANLFNSLYIYVGRELLAMAVTACCWLVMPVALVLAGARFGLNGIWTALGTAPLLSLAAMAMFVRLKYGRSLFPLLVGRERDASIRVFNLSVAESEVAAVAEAVAAELKAIGADGSKVMRARLMTEEVLMAVKDRNGAKRVLAEVTLDLNDGIMLTIRDDGEIFDITDADAKISSLRTYLVASVMENHSSRMNLVTTGYNRNVFRF